MHIYIQSNLITKRILSFDVYIRYTIYLVLTVDKFMHIYIHNYNNK